MGVLRLAGAVLALPMLVAGASSAPNVAAAAEIKECAAVAKLPSGTQPGAASVTVENQARETLHLVWHGYDGSLADYATLEPGQKVLQQSYETQIWELDNAAGCACAFVLAAGEQSVTMTAAGSCQTMVAETAPSYEPTASYLIQQVAGWTVLVSSRFDQNLAKAVVIKLRAELQKIRDLLPPHALAVLQQVRIWLEVDDAKMPAPGVYESSRQWLQQNGENPDKAGAVRLTADFVEAVDRQPMIVLHQLALAYMDREVGFSAPELVAAFETARTSDKYESVDALAGGKAKAEAVANQAEYFAELSEAYWGQNDFFPFTRKDLQAFDPQGYALVDQAWHKLD